MVALVHRYLAACRLCPSCQQRGLWVRFTRVSHGPLWYRARIAGRLPGGCGWKRAFLDLLATWTLRFGRLRNGNGCPRVADGPIVVTVASEFASKQTIPDWIGGRAIAFHTGRLGPWNGYSSSRRGLRRRCRAWPADVTIGSP